MTTIKYVTIIVHKIGADAYKNKDYSSFITHDLEFSWLKSILHYICVCLHLYIDWKACAVWTCPCSAGCTEGPTLHVDYIHVAALLYFYYDWW